MPTVIIDAVAFYKDDACETEAEQVFQVNCIAVHHRSAEYVFNGKGYVNLEAPAEPAR